MEKCHLSPPTVYSPMPIDWTFLFSFVNPTAFQGKLRDPHIFFSGDWLLDLGK